MNFNNNRYVDKIFSKEEICAATQLLTKGLKNSWELNIIFEEKFAKYYGCNYALACTNGTMAMEEALWACGVKSGDEIIAPIMTYWASAYPALKFGAKIRYADIDPETLCISPEDIKRKITSKTKAIIVVHLYGHPCDMDEIIEIASNNNIKIIEDFSHAHGALYKGKKVGTIGDVGVASCMGEKAFYLPEGGILCTNSKDIYEKSCLYGHYRHLGIREHLEKKEGTVLRDDWEDLIGAPLGAVKNRMNPMSVVIGIERLDSFDAYLEELTMSMNYFIEKLEESGFYKGHVIRDRNCSMGGWYSPVIFSEKNTKKLSKAIRLKGIECFSGHKYFKLDEHPINNFDFFRENLTDYHSLDSNKESFKGMEESNSKIISIPSFSRFNKKIIDEYVAVYISAAEEVE